MSFVKKTVILSGKKGKGYVTVFQIGSDTGIKVVGDNLAQGLVCGVKIGERMYCFDLEGQRTEWSVQCESIKTNDEIGCIVLAEDEIVLQGGKRVFISEVKDFFAVSQEIVSEEEAKEQKEEVLERLQKGTEHFYRSIRDKVDELFIVYPPEEKLNQAMPGSCWVKVKYEKEDYYVVGKIFEQDTVVSLGYGVPGKKEVAPPKATETVAEWVAVEGLRFYDGYWMFFQDAETGKIL